MTQQLTISPQKKLLDEGSFQELLAAAFVLQQHSEVSNDRSANSIEILSQIVRIQRSIQGGKLDLLATAKLISQQLQKFTRADGAAIGIVTETELIYLAAVGTASHDIGNRAPIDSSLPAQCIRSGLTFQSASVLDDTRMLSSPSDQVDLKSLIAVPVEYENRVVAVLEARFRTVNAFENDDVRTCELMAPLAREIISRAGRRGQTETELIPKLQPENGTSESFHATATEAEAPQAAVEEDEVASVMSQQEQLPREPHVAAPAAEDEIVITSVNGSEIEPASADAALCRGCGQHLAEEEAFCGKCGTERMLKPDGPLQSKWASLWYMKQARRSVAKKDSKTPEGLSVATRQKVLKPPPSEADQPLQDALVARSSSERSGVRDQITASAHAQPSFRLQWLPEIGASRRQLWLSHQWHANRGNFYLAGAAVLLIIALSGWGTTPAIEMRPAANSSAPQLTLLERMLVNLGIAEAPETPVSSGNPDTPVWVDLHTALYYCPGSDLYGKTEGGKIASQRSAQLDQFEPAHRKACN